MNTIIHDEHGVAHCEDEQLADMKKHGWRAITEQEKADLDKAAKDAAAKAAKDQNGKAK